MSTWLYCFQPEKCAELRKKHPKGSDPLGMRRVWEEKHAALHRKEKE